MTPQQILEAYIPRKIKAYGEVFETESMSRTPTTAIPKRTEHNQELFFNTIKRGMRT